MGNPELREAELWKRHVGGPGMAGNTGSSKALGKLGLGVGILF